MGGSWVGPPYLEGKHVVLFYPRLMRRLRGDAAQGYMVS